MGLSSEIAIWVGGTPPALPLPTASRSVTVIGIVTITTTAPWGTGAWTWEISSRRRAVRRKGETGRLQAGSDKAFFALQMTEVVNTESWSC